MTIPKSVVDDPVVFPLVGRIPDTNLNLVSPTNKILINYKAYMDPTSTGILPKKVTFKAVDGSSKEAKLKSKNKRIYYFCTC